MAMNSSCNSMMNLANNSNNNAKSKGRQQHNIQYVANNPLTGSMSAPVCRIRTPHAHDVLCGRGGGINSHEGNKIFRNWVRERKEAYNLAPSKAAKATVSREILDRVRCLNPPGRFLMREDMKIGGSASAFWVEIDDTKAMAKTSQALREGAPSIRAKAKAMQEKTFDNSKMAGEKTVFPPKLKFQVTSTETERPTKIQKVNMDSTSASQEIQPKITVEIPPTALSPPLLSQEPPTLLPIPCGPLPHPFSSLPTAIPQEFSSLRSRKRCLSRTHSLALSDISGYSDIEEVDADFKDPFAGDDDNNVAADITALEGFPDFSAARSSRLSRLSSTGSAKLEKSVDGSTRSLISELSDLPDIATVECHNNWDEGMKDIYDATHSSIADGEETLETVLYPYKTTTTNVFNRSYRNDLRVVPRNINQSSMMRSKDQQQ